MRSHLDTRVHMHYDDKSTVGKASTSVQYQWLSVSRLQSTMASDLEGL